MYVSISSLSDSDLVADLDMDDTGYRVNSISRSEWVDEGEVFLEIHITLLKLPIQESTDGEDDETSSDPGASESGGFPGTVGSPS